MIQYPLVFCTQASAHCGIGSTWKVRSSDYEVEVCVPTEFEGPGGVLSPEDLFAQALTNCFMATFKVLAEKSGVTFDRIDVSGRLIVDRDEQKRPMMKSFHFVIGLNRPSDAAKASRLIEKAMQGGFILNSVKTTLSHEVVVTG